MDCEKKGRGTFVAARNSVHTRPGNTRIGTSLKYHRREIRSIGSD